MYLSPTLVTLVAVLSFSSTLIATDVIRVPLQRRSNFNSRDFATPANNEAGCVDADFLKNHLLNVASKYHTTLLAYEFNTGIPHPLAVEISKAVDCTGIWADVGKASSLGVLSLVKAFESGLALDNSLDHVPKSRHTRRDDISLSEVNSNMWMCTISIGTPPQDFSVDFDTGSSDIILPAHACGSSCDGHTRYDAAASSTFVNLGKTFQMAYGGGSSVNGSQIADDVYMGKYEAINQTFGAATTYSDGLKSPTFMPDGLLGMAFSPVSIFHASTVFQTLVSDGVVAQGVFGVALSSEPGKSEVTIGGTNTDVYQESTTEYINVSPPAYWQIPFAGLSRPGLDDAPDVVVVNKTSYAQAIIDTGTTLIITSDGNAQAFYANVPGAKLSPEWGAGVWSVPCDTVGSLAPTLTFGSRSFTISSSTFNLGPVSGGSTDCIAGIAGGGSPYWIIGDVFLQSVYTIFDVSNTRVGFADLR